MEVSFPREKKVTLFSEPSLASLEMVIPSFMGRSCSTVNTSFIENLLYETWYTWHLACIPGPHQNRTDIVYLNNTDILRKMQEKTYWKCNKNFSRSTEIFSFVQKVDMLR